MTIPPAGAHGGDGPAIAAALGLDPDELLDLSQSLNPLAPDPAPVVGRHVGAVRTYPDPSVATAALAQTMGVGAERLLLTNGGAEAIALVAAELGGHVVEPEFGLYPRGGRALWRSNPNSPTGLLAAKDDRADVWDEAFFGLATGRWTRGDDSVVVSSLTKLLACPGLRVGYVLADPVFLERLRHRQPEWSVGGPAVASLPQLLDAVDLEVWSAGVARLRFALVTMLRTHGLTVRPSDANWVLVERGGLREALAPHGVVVRDCSSFGMAGVTRISVPSAAGLERLDAALAAVLERAAMSS